MSADLNAIRKRRDLACLDSAIRLDPKGPWRIVKNDLNTYGYGPYYFNFFGLSCKLDRGCSDWEGSILLPQTNPFSSLDEERETWTDDEDDYDDPDCVTLDNIVRKYNINVHGGVSSYSDGLIRFKTGVGYDVKMDTVLILLNPEGQKTFLECVRYCRSRGHLYFWTFENSRDELQRFAAQIARM